MNNKNRRFILEELIRSVEEEIAELERLESQEYYLWKDGEPFEDDSYWFVGYSDKELSEGKWGNLREDRGRRSIGNMFRIKEEALFYIEKRKVLTKLRKHACSDGCYGLRYNALSKDIVVTPLDEGIGSVLAFKSEDIAKKALDEVGRERVSRYLFGESNSRENSNRIEELNKTLASLKRELRVLVSRGAGDFGFWVPDDSESYWYICSDGSVDMGIWDIMDEDTSRLSVGNVFRTKADALFELRRLELMTLIKPYTCNFRRDDSPLYVIVPSGVDEVSVRPYDDVCLMDCVVYFDSEDKAYKAIEVAGKAKILKYLLGVNADAVSDLNGEDSKARIRKYLFGL